MLTNELNNDPVQLLAALRARGVRLGLVEDERGLTPTFGGNLTADDRAALAAHREGLLACLLAEARAAAARRDDDAAAEGRAINWSERGTGRGPTSPACVPCCWPCAGSTPRRS